MAKRSCRTNVSRDGVDKISTLPDDVSVRILSLIPTEEAVTTSFMSKRWKFLWTLLPNLDFDFVRFSRMFDDLSLGDQQRRFLDFVEHVFFLHQSEPLEKLRLAFGIVELDNYTSKASLLVKSAMRSNCLSIDLDFSSQRSYILYPNQYDKLYTLPPCYFPHQSVSELKLSNCKFVPSFYTGFTSVNIVKFTTVQLQKDSVCDLVTKCPRLEELHLIRCQILSYFFELIAPESNLKCLVLQDCFGNEGLPFGNGYIHIPTLLQLKFEGSFISGYLSVHNPQNLIDAEIKIAYRLRDEYKLLCKLLKDLQNVKSLTLSSTNLKVLNTSGGITSLSSFYNLKDLTVKLGQADEDLLGLICLLRSPPCLETLSVDFHLNYELKSEILSTLNSADEEAVLQPHLLPSECVAHLKKIKIEHFQGLKVEMEFVKLILQNSLCLKELVICIHSRYCFLKAIMGKEHSKTLKKKKTETIDSLMACKRASPDAQILLK